MEIVSELSYGRIKPCMHEYSQYEIIEMALDDIIGAKTLVMMAKLLIDTVGKEEAGERMLKVRYDEYYKWGKMEAEQLGNPKDLDSLLETFLRKSPPWVYICQFAYRTERKAVVRTVNHCFEAEAIKKYSDKEMQEFLANYFCGQHDIGFAQGFLPGLKFKHTKHHLRGDDCCEFVLELAQ